jgi:hypothetical protein
MNQAPSSAMQERLTHATKMKDTGTEASFAILPLVFC